MTDYNLTGVTGLLAYLWVELQDIGWTEVNGAIPFHYAQQDPELMTANPFLVYNWNFVGQDVTFETIKEQAIFIVYHQDRGIVGQAVNLIANLFKRYDWSAQDVNDFIDGTSSDELKKFDYKQIKLVTANGPNPAESEGGRHEGIVSISYEYTRDLDDRGIYI